MIESFFDKSIRVCFTNFWSNLYESNHDKFFINPVMEYFIHNRIKFRLVKQYDPHIQFFSVFGNVTKIKKSKANIKVFFSGENINTFKQKFIQYKGNYVNFVNLSMGFDYLEEKNYLRFPLWLIYFFSPDNSKDEIKTKLDSCKTQHNKTKFCSLIASHDRNGIRTKMFNDVSVISNIDCPGKLFNNDNTLHSRYNNDKLLYLQQYKFNICPENSVSDGYVTEKIFDCLHSGCIPIYSGWNKNPEPDIINPDIILWYDELDKDNNKYILNEIKKLNESDRLYRSFIEQPFFCDTAVDKIFNFLSEYNSRMQILLNIFPRKPV